MSEFDEIVTALSGGDTSPEKRALDALIILQERRGNAPWLTAAIDTLHATLYNLAGVDDLGRALDADGNPYETTHAQLTLDMAVELADIEGYTVTISGLRQACRTGRIPGATKFGNTQTAPWSLDRTQFMEWLNDPAAHKRGARRKR